MAAHDEPHKILQHAEHFHRVHHSKNTFNSENGNLKENDDKQKNMISIENKMRSIHFQ